MTRPSLAVRLGGVLLGAGAIAGTLGCATTSPILVEPRVPAVGDLRTQLGGAVLAPIAGDRDALPSARAVLSGAGAKPSDDELIAAGSAVVLAARPGVAPMVRASVGAARGVEAGVRYGGRDVAAHGRWTFLEHRSDKAQTWTLSVGLEGKSLLMLRPDDGVFPGVAVDNLRGWGGALPLVAAWQSDAGLVFAWVATSVGVDRTTARLTVTARDAPPDAPLKPLDATVLRAWGAATVGIGVGFRRVHVLVELGIQRDVLHADVGPTSTSVRLWSLTPAFALSTNL